MLSRSTSVSALVFTGEFYTHFSPVFYFGSARPPHPFCRKATPPRHITVESYVFIAGYTRRHVV